MAEMYTSMKIPGRGLPESFSAMQALMIFLYAMVILFVLGGNAVDIGKTATGRAEGFEYFTAP